MKYQKVLLLAIPIQDVVRPPGAMSILASCCEQVGSEYQFLDINLGMHKTLPANLVKELKADLELNNITEKTRNHFAKLCDSLHSKIDEFQPDLIAISVFAYTSITSAILILEQLQKRSDRKNFSVVLGGLGVSSKIPRSQDKQSFDNWVRSNNMAEYVIKGEGEVSFVELLRGNDVYPGINGVPAQQLTNLDQIPTPSYKKINPREYFYSDAPEIVLTGSKGCVRDCSFCDVGHHWKKYVYRSGEKIADDLFEIWKQTGIDKFDFSDSLINGSIKNFRAFNQRIVEIKLNNPEFLPRYKGQFICRPVNQMKYHDYELMRDAGVETLVVGIEHFSPSVRDHMGKHFDNSAIDWHFETCARLGIKNVLLLLSGYVTETLNDHLKNLEYLEKYQVLARCRIIYSINIDIQGLMIIPETPLYEILHSEFPNTDFNNEFWVYPKNPDLTPMERLRRGAEVVYTAADLGYNILHFEQKMTILKRTMKDYANRYEPKKVFGILKI